MNSSTVGQKAVLVLTILSFMGLLAAVGMLAYIVNTMNTQNGTPSLLDQLGKWLTGSEEPTGAGAGAGAAAAAAAVAVVTGPKSPDTDVGAAPGKATTTTAPRLTADLVKALVQSSKKSKGALYLWAVSNGCGACAHQTRVLDELAAAGSLKGTPIAGLLPRNEWLPDMKPRFIPTLYVIENGKLVEKSSGAMDAAAVLALK